MIGSLPVSGDNQKTKIEIPIRNLRDKPMIRSLTEDPIQAYYLGSPDCIQTTVSSDIGDVDVFVTNTSTGEMWSAEFDSASSPQYILFVSGESGLYEVVYTTENGDVYEGTFLL